MSSSQPKAVRSRLARKTLTQTIPEVLRSSSRARSGVDLVKLLRDKDLKPHIPSKVDFPPPGIRVVAADVLQAAFNIVSKHGAGRVAVLSMASELRPGGGFLSGANSQEESLCMRTTLYPSLHDDFYRLPDLGCVYTPDVCVFRGEYVQAGDEDVEPQPTSSTLEVNMAKKWWFVDVISCAAVRGPELDESGGYANPAQKDLMREKIKRIFRTAALKGCRRLVLGAFGCGAFGNPPGEVAALFHRVLFGRDGTGTGKKGGEFVGCFDEVVFAIKGSSANVQAFQAAFQDHSG